MLTGKNQARLCPLRYGLKPFSISFAIHRPFDPSIGICYNQKVSRVSLSRQRTFLSSSMAEHSAVNRRVVGSSPTSGAINTKKFSNLQKPPKRWLYSFWSSGCFGGCRDLVAVLCRSIQFGCACSRVGSRTGRGWIVNPLSRQPRCLFRVSLDVRPLDST